MDTGTWFVGVDWGQAEHALCLVDTRGQVCGRRRVAHTVAAIDEAVRWLCAQTGTGPEAIAVAIEAVRALPIPHLEVVDDVVEGDVIH